MEQLTTQIMYRAFGLNIISDIYFPELTQVTEKYGDIDIIIRFDYSSKLREVFKESSLFCIVKDKKVFIRVPNIAYFSIESGSKIICTPIGSIKENQIRLYLLGTCMGALLLQRKIIPLHGSVVEINKKAYGVVGESGAGKSTLAATLLNQGYRLLTDDIIPVTLESGIPMVLPSYPQQKLWKESLDALKVSSDQYQPIFDRENKFLIPLHSKFYDEQIPLAGIFELVTGAEEVTLRPLNKLEQIKKLFEHTFRSFLVERLDLLEWHFNITTTLANSTMMYQLTRPESRFTTKELSDLILEVAQKE
ncbi:aldolase [Bacillus sp. Y1]|nr:aldolase [Bacillus sp. Y1]AYA77622.1 aldolase [Bacillus sp. Y1]